MFFIKKLIFIILAVVLICSIAFLCIWYLNTKPVPIELVNKNGNAIYRLVRPENVNLDTSADIKEFKRSLENLVGANFELTTDAPSESDSTDVYEILIGATNRPESIEARKNLTENDYLIRVSGKKIIITGSSDITTKKAMDLFLEMLGSGNKSSLMSDTNVLISIERGPYLVGLTSTNKGFVEVYDITNGKLDNDSLVWSFKMDGVSGLKLRHSDKYGDVMLATGGNNYGCMVSYPDGKVLWSTNATASNPHSIELLPNGIIAIASSDGNEVRFFNSNEQLSEIAGAMVSLKDAHGVLWDEDKGVLWAVGWDVLTAYKATLNADGSINVTEDINLRTTIPSIGAHDLAPVYGTENELWISTWECVYRFNTETMTFSTDYKGHKAINVPNVKGIGNFDDGTTVFIYPDGTYKGWTSKSIYFVKENAEEVDKFTSDSEHFYKIRIWDTRYR